jgi:uncharacterized protein
MGIRLLFVLIVIALVIWLVRRLWLGRDTPRREISSQMVRCAHCGLHVPTEEAIEANGRHYCCEDHRDADRSD